MRYFMIGQINFVADMRTKAIENGLSRQDDVT